MVDDKISNRQRRIVKQIFVTLLLKMTPDGSESLGEVNKVLEVHNLQYYARNAYAEAIKIILMADRLFPSMSIC